MEEWEIIPEFPRYMVSNEGRVQRHATGRIMALRINRFGVVNVGLMNDRVEQYNRSVPLLVATAFVPNVRSLWNTPIHVDGDRHNCFASNLEWRPRWYAIKYHQQFVHPSAGSIFQRIVDVATGLVYESSRDVALAMGLLESDVVLSILNNTTTWPTFQKFELLEE